MRQRNNKEIVKCKLFGTKKLMIIAVQTLSNYILRHEHFSFNMATGLYYELRLNILIQLSCKLFILLRKFSIQCFFIVDDRKLKLFSCI